MNFGFVSFKGGLAYANPIASKLPNQTAYPYGDTVTLVCKVYGQYSIRWYKAGSNESLKSSLTYANDVNKAVFTIPCVTKSDEGTYVCEIKRRIVNYVANTTVTVRLEKNEG